jgi:tetratricopeptide (TPR) repeat protein
VQTARMKLAQAQDLYDLQQAVQELEATDKAEHEHAEVRRVEAELHTAIQRYQVTHDLLAELETAIARLDHEQAADLLCQAAEAPAPQLQAQLEVLRTLTAHLQRAAQLSSEQLWAEALQCYAELIVCRPALAALIQPHVEHARDQQRMVVLREVQTLLASQPPDWQLANQRIEQALSQHWLRREDPEVRAPLRQIHEYHTQIELMRRLNQRRDHNWEPSGVLVAWLAAQRHPETTPLLDQLAGDLTHLHAAEEAWANADATTALESPEAIKGPLRDVRRVHEQRRTVLEVILSKLEQNLAAYRFAEVEQVLRQTEVGSEPQLRERFAAAEAQLIQRRDLVRRTNELLEHCNEARQRADWPAAFTQLQIARITAPGYPATAQLLEQVQAQAYGIARKNAETRAYAEALAIYELLIQSDEHAKHFLEERNALITQRNQAAHALRAIAQRELALWRPREALTALEASRVVWPEIDDLAELQALIQMMRANVGPIQAQFERGWTAFTIREHHLAGQAFQAVLDGVDSRLPYLREAEIWLQAVRQIEQGAQQILSESMYDEQAYDRAVALLGRAVELFTAHEEARLPTAFSRPEELVQQRVEAAHYASQLRDLAIEMRTQYNKQAELRRIGKLKEANTMMARVVEDLPQRFQQCYGANLEGRAGHSLAAKRRPAQYEPDASHPGRNDEDDR